MSHNVPPAYPRVIAVFPDGPAAQYGHGIRVGDEVLKVNRVEIKNKTQDEVGPDECCDKLHSWS